MATAAALSIDHAALGRVALKTWPEAKMVSASQLWATGPCLVFAVRRMGWPYCRQHAKEILERREELWAAGISRMVVVSAQATGAEDFIEAVWQGGELFVDEDEAFKKALGGLPYKNRWLFKPSVLARLGSVVGNGRDFSDLNDKSQMLGGTMVVDRSGVLFAKPESESFAHAEVDEVLAAMRAGNVAPTPATRDEM